VVRMEPVIRVNNLSRTFSSKEGIKHAVSNISFSVYAGQIFGLLGPNGAGKSTTIKMLTTLLLPSSGEVSVLGHDVYQEEAQIRPRIGLLYGGEHGLYWQLSGRDNLRFFGSLFKLNKKELEECIDYWLERVGLEKDQNQLVSRYSKGMKQRLHIARAMLHDPELIFMDEPTLGLDPQGTLDLRQIIKELKKQGKTIILTTHDMEEAEELCDQIAFIMDGQLVQQGTFEELQNGFQEVSSYEIELIHSPDKIMGTLQDYPLEWGGMERLSNGNTVLTFSLPKTEEGEKCLSEIVSLLSPYSMCQLIRKKMDLRTIYLQLVKSSCHDQKTESA
jgi:ABC-2 type transport system ATP-binding protein